MRKTLLAAVALTVLFAAPTNAAVNIITNGDFESGSFDGWTSSGNNALDGVQCPGPSSTVYNGNCSAFFGAVGSPSTLSQTLATTIGQTYFIYFWGLGFGDDPSLFTVNFGGSPTFSLGDPGSGTYTPLGFYHNATSASTTLTFTFRNDHGVFQYLDLVSVEAVFVPEPSTWAMMLIGLGLIGATLRAKRRRRPEFACLSYASML